MSRRQTAVHEASAKAHGRASGLSLRFAGDFNQVGKNRAKTRALNFAVAFFKKSIAPIKL